MVHGKVASLEKSEGIIGQPKPLTLFRSGSQELQLGAQVPFREERQDPSCSVEFDRAAMIVKDAAFLAIDRDLFLPGYLHEMGSGFDREARRRDRVVFVFRDGRNELRHP
ncbi:hypothetical protein [Bradyrhizobium sp. DOA9]|uniref:hypothetical protein n=1 Tax=Bradyrhizobium sp. DOA9 TaxID=1126627 RepID=UPI001FCD0708|nr:hypothetical protein [Bradyrhizobium sp. DOA9]